MKVICHVFFKPTEDTPPISNHCKNIFLFNVYCNKFWGVWHRLEIELYKFKRKALLGLINDILLDQ